MSTPKTIFNIENFEKLCRAVDNMDHDLCNLYEDVDKYFKSGLSNLSFEDMSMCSFLLEQYRILEEATKVSQDYKQTKLTLEKEDQTNGTKQ